MERKKKKLFYFIKTIFNSEFLIFSLIMPNYKVK